MVFGFKKLIKSWQLSHFQKTIMYWYLIDIATYLTQIESKHPTVEFPETEETKWAQLVNEQFKTEK